MRLTIRAMGANDANIANEEVDANEIPGRSFPGSDMAEVEKKFSRTGGTAGTDPCGWPGSAEDGKRDSTPPHRMPGRERRARPPAGG